MIRFFSQSSAKSPAISSLALALVLASCLSACTNIQNAARSAARKLSSTDSNTGTSPDGGAYSILTITRVMVSTADPGSFDVVGDGSGQIGQYCMATSATGATTSGPSTCSCTYSYTKTDGTSEAFDAPTTYFEGNLVRCSNSNIPVGIPNVKVKIHLTNADAYSNEITFSYAGSGSSLDLSNPQSFVQVQRYQCRDIITIPSLFPSGGIYDPFQSEDIKLSYPINFYTTNFGATFSIYAGANISNWNCPAIPNDPKAGMDLTLFSVGADSAGSKRIYPPTGSVFDRSTFQLARQPAGIFNMPVDAYLAPGIITSPPASGTTSTDGGPPPSLGYGAMPIPAGTDKETCPDSSIVIPAGYKWVKVWLFRADLVSRKYKTSSKLTQANNIACNPGTYAQGGLAVFPDCAVGAGSPRNMYTAGAGLADRLIAGNQMCVTPSAGVAPAPYSSGSDVWTNVAGSPYRCGNGNIDILGICTAPNVPHHTDSTVDPITLVDLDVGNPRFDFVFVVTPPSVMSADMRNSANASNYPYTPYRFYNKGDCNSPDPDNPLTPGDCDPNKVIRYGLKLHDVGSNGDPPPSTTTVNTNRAGVFPVCALQPI